MKDTLRVLFRTEASHSVGLGHLSRSRSLALALGALRPCVPIFAVNDPDLARFLLGENVQIITPDSLGSIEPFDITIVDMLTGNASDLAYLRHSSELFVGVSDDVFLPLPFDLVIRPTPLPGLAAGCDSKIVLHGGEHVILHPSFARRATFPRALAPRVDHLLVCFGGSDPCNYTMRILPLFNMLPEHLAIHIIIGSAFSNAEALAAHVGADSRIQVSQNHQDMAEAFSQADAALISGGTLLFEACALGVPAVVLSQNFPQEEEAAYFAGQGAVIALGTTFSDHEVFSSLQQIFSDARLRANLSAAGRRLVFADGVNRIARYLLATLKGQNS